MRIVMGTDWDDKFCGMRMTTVVGFRVGVDQGKGDVWVSVMSGVEVLRGWVEE